MTNTYGSDVLAGKVAFVAGGTRGMNLEIARRYAQQGAKVAVLSRNQERVDAAVAELKDIGNEVLGFSADVRDYDAIDVATRATAEQLGPIDLVVAGQAGNFYAPANGMSANGFKAVIDIDLLGTFNTCRAAYEHLRKPGASIVAISATHAFRPIPMQAHVCAGKAGVDILIKTLAVEWGPAGVRANVVTPGPVDDTEGMRRLAPSQEIRARLTEAIPLRRFAIKDEIASLALFLCTNAAAYITGAIFVCDGGQSLTGSSFAALGP